jgi:hypothetical protein
MLYNIFIILIFFSEAVFTKKKCDNSNTVQRELDELSVVYPYDVIHYKCLEE